MNHFTLAFLILAFSLSQVFADSEIELPPIEKQGTPGEILIEDSIVPAQKGDTQLNAGNGTLQNSLQNQLPLPSINYGRPGFVSQVKGLSPSNEDLDVQALGISLNPPQGGGFDLSIFPQFLWSGFRYQMGPSLNTLNPTASAGTLTLTPWTSAVLTRPGWGGRAAEFYSSSGVNQISLGIKDGERFAGVVGYSSLRVNGPSAAVTGRWGSGQGVGRKEGVYSGGIHVLASQLDSESPGPSYAPTPQARLKNTRVIPILENQFRITESSVLKSSIFYDWGKLDYGDPGNSIVAISDIQQWGIENVYLIRPWKFGLSARQVQYSSSYSQSNLTEISQSVGNIQVSRDFEVASWRVEPTFQGVWVTGLGLMPQGSLGGRKEWDANSRAVFSRVSLSRRVPSLLDRYSVDPTFIGNPNLQTELDWTGVLGGEVRGTQAEGTLQLYSQFRQNARVATETSVTNLNDAYVLAAMGSSSFHLMDWIDLLSSLTASYSRLTATGGEFPYVPNLIGIFGFSLHSRGQPSRWEWFTTLRLSSSQVSSPLVGGRVPAYGQVDTGIRVAVWQGISLMGRIENVADTPLELIRGYPLGRSFSVTVFGEL